MAGKENYFSIPAPWYCELQKTDEQMGRQGAR